MLAMMLGRINDNKAQQIPASSRLLFKCSLCFMDKCLSGVAMRAMPTR
jgi:hypothetical protein